MKHEHNVCTWTETCPSIEPAPFAVFTQYPGSPSALPSSGSPRGAGSCQHSSSGSKATTAPPAQAVPPAPAATSHSLWDLWGCCQGPAHPDRHPRALPRVTPCTSLPLWTHESSETKRRWIAHSRVPSAHCLPKARLPPLALWAVMCVPTNKPLYMDTGATM